MLNNRDFVIAIAGRAVSAFGDEMALVALALRLQGAHAHPYEVALLLAVGLLPTIALAGVAGRVADAVDSRLILVLASLVQLACCVPLVFATGPVVTIALAGGLGVGTAFAEPTWQALLPRIVGEDRLGSAISTQQTASTVALLAAPALSGLLCAAVGTRLPVAIDAGTFAVMAVAALAVRTRRAYRPTGEAVEPAAPTEAGAEAGPEAGAEAGPGVGDQPVEPAAVPAGGAGAAASSTPRSGWRVLRADPVLAPLVAGLAVFVLLAMMVNVLLVFLVRQTLHAGGGWYGGLEATWMVGVIAGAAAARRVTNEWRRAVTAVVGCGIIAFALLGYGLTPTVVGLVPLSVLGGFGNGLINSCVATLVMTRTDEALRGRVAATLGGIVATASVCSLVLGGALAVVLDPRPIFWLVGGLGVVAAIGAAAGLAAARRRERDRDLDRDLDSDGDGDRHAAQGQSERQAARDGMAATRS
jgi:MFS family permease